MIDEVLDLSRIESGRMTLSPEAVALPEVLVEDNPSNVAFMRELLTEFERVALHVAPTAEIGVELIRTRRPNVVLMDINLPGMSGIDAIRLLKRWPETREIPVIALSAAAMKHDLQRVQAEGFYRYLTKPVNVPELIAVLEKLLTPPALPPRRRARDGARDPARRVLRRTREPRHVDSGALG